MREVPSRAIATVLGTMGVYSLLSIYMTWPLIRDWWDHIPENLGDPLLNTWIMAWVTHALSEGQVLGLFHANIFHPTPYSLALSEHLLANQWLFGPAYLFTGNPVFAYNLVLFASFILSGLAMHWLAFHWTGSHAGGFLAGIVFAFFPARFAQLGHLQLLGLYWTPLALLFLDRYLKGRKFGDLSLLVVCAALQSWVSFYLGYFLLLMMATYYLVFQIWRWERPRKRDLLAPVGIVAAVFPLAYPYLRIKSMFRLDRGLAEVVTFSADLGTSFLSVPPSNWLYGESFSRLEYGAVERCLFWGFVPMALVLVALIQFFWSRRIEVLACLAIVFVAAVLSLGPVLLWFGEPIFSPMPYRFLYEVVPGFSSMRVPGRIMMVGFVGVAGLAAFSLPRKRWNVVLGSVLALLVLAEYQVRSITLVEVQVSDEVPEVYTWLAEQEGTGAVLELPAGRPEWDIRALYFSTYHYKPLVNGYSGFTPGYYDQTLARLSQGINRQALHYLQAIGVEYILLRDPRRRAAVWERLVESGDLKEAFEGEGIRVLIPADKVELGSPEIYVESLQLDAVAPATEVETGIVFHTEKKEGVWKNPEIDGVEPVEATWVGARREERFETSVLIPAAITGRAWVPITLRTPSSPGVYELTLKGKTFSLRKSVQVTGWRSDFYDGQVLPLESEPVVLTFSPHGEDRYLTVDGYLDTRWATKAPQRPGMSVEIDLLREMETRGVQLRLGPTREEYPRGLVVYGSRDGKSWTPLEDTEQALLVTFDPSTPLWRQVAAFRWSPRTLRYLRLRLEGYSPNRWWAFAELSVYGSRTGEKLPNSATTRDLSPRLRLVDFELDPIFPQARVELQLENLGEAVWLKFGPEGRGSVRVGARWFQDGVESAPAQRMELPRAVFPGESVTLEEQLDLPARAGRYELHIDVVNEGIAWIESGIDRYVEVPGR